MLPDLPARHSAEWNRMLDNIRDIGMSLEEGLEMASENRSKFNVGWP